MHIHFFVIHIRKEKSKDNVQYNQGFNKMSVPKLGKNNMALYNKNLKTILILDNN